MKKNLSIFLVLLTVMSIMLFSVGCDMDDMQGENNNNTSASPSTSVNNTGDPMNGSGDEIIGDGESVIEGFVEGQEINEADLPQNILSAIKENAEDMLISGISYATNVGKQAYRVILSQTGMGTSREIYVTANGEVIPTTDENSGTQGPSQSSTASASPNTSESEGK